MKQGKDRQINTREDRKSIDHLCLVSAVIDDEENRLKHLEWMYSRTNEEEMLREKPDIIKRKRYSNADIFTNDKWKTPNTLIILAGNSCEILYDDTDDGCVKTETRRS